ncbi:hypothetical protein CXU21_03205 [Akkermansia muciniphila]|nr:hypothetical protein CXU21_03205 [Akkermansia muciniphila]
MERAGGLSGNPGSGSCRRTVRTSQLELPATSGKAGMMEGGKNLMPEKTSMIQGGFEIRTGPRYCAAGSREGR